MAGSTPHSGSMSEMGSVPTPQTHSVAASTPTETTGGRILDPYRSALSPITVEALICTQNWLKPNKIIISLEEGDQAVSSACSGVTTVGESEVQSSMPPSQTS